MTQQKKQETKTLVERLLAFQGQMPKIYKESDNPYFKSKYATYENIMKLCLPVLNENGLLVSHYTFIENDKEYLKTVVCSIENEKIQSISPVIPNKNDVQSKGAYFTYMKRYHVVMLLGLSVFDENDDDGESLMDGFIKKDQEKQIQILLNGRKDLESRILKAYNISELRFLPRSEFNKCQNGIVKELEKEKQ